MDAFEQLVSEILWMEGYWVRTSVKVELTKEEKRQIGRPSPRWELDIVAYSGRDNSLRVVECKSYLDSRGVALRAFDGSDAKNAERYKLFADDQSEKCRFRSAPAPIRGIWRVPLKSGGQTLPGMWAHCYPCGPHRSARAF